MEKEILKTSLNNSVVSLQDLIRNLNDFKNTGFKNEILLFEESIVKSLEHIKSFYQRLESYSETNEVQQTIQNNTKNVYNICAEFILKTTQDKLEKVEIGFKSRLEKLKSFKELKITATPIDNSNKLEILCIAYFCLETTANIDKVSCELTKKLKENFSSFVSLKVN